jgi:uncharacterized membrane protein YgdD (TMEM256/DUF423 family)
MNFPRYKLWLLLGAVLGCVGVALGAFGAHGLESHLKSTLGADVMLSDLERATKLSDRLDNWETAARYQMYHALALLAVGLVAARRCSLAVNLAGVAMTLGTLLFSGCLYVFVLTGEHWLVHVVPIGGLLLIVGWACLVIAVLKDAGVPPAAS